MSNLHPEVELRQVCDLYKNMYNIDISGWNLDDVIDHIRHMILADFNSTDDLLVMKNWLDKQ